MTDVSSHHVLVQHLDDVGNGSGSINANGDYSSVADEFFIAPSTSEVFDIYMLLAAIVDGGVTIASDGYGELASLTNGVLIDVQNASGQLFALTDVTIKTNAVWGHFADLSFFDSFSGDNHIVASWDLVKTTGSPLRLKGSDSEKLVVTLNDDLSGLSGHHFLAMGRKLDETY